MKVAFLVPSTTNKRDWKGIEETYLFQILFTGLERYPPNGMDITVYVGYNDDDKIYSIYQERLKCNAIFTKFNIEWIPFDSSYKGKVTTIWNVLGETALDDGFKYFKVLGDDIQIPKDRGWLGYFVNQLKKNNNIGFSAGFSNNTRIPTQFLVHETHLKIFGFIYANEIPNWGCDDWMFEVYPKKYQGWYKQINLPNMGGEPRYEVTFNPRFVTAIVKRYKPKFNRFLSEKNN
jgi:hypothetical protein